MRTHRLIISECTANPSIGLTRRDIREQTYVNPDTAIQSFENALMYWAKKGKTETKKGNPHFFTTVIAEDQYWVTVELKEEA